MSDYKVLFETVMAKVETLIANHEALKTLSDAQSQRLEQFSAQFKQGNRMLTPEEALPDWAEFGAGVHALVEASSFERSSLWGAWGKDSPQKIREGFTWVQKNPGCFFTIGYLNGDPIVMCMMRAVVNGKLIVFWELTSQVRDYRMAETFLKQLVSPTVIQTNADNFHAVNVR
jgi:hypothetical protein